MSEYLAGPRDMSIHLTVGLDSHVWWSVADELLFDARKMGLCKSLEQAVRGDCNQVLCCIVESVGCALRFSVNATTITRFLATFGF
jgi:hypothetical protein